MKVLILIRRNPARRFLVELHTTKLVKEVTQLLSRRRNSQAIATTLAKGRFDKEVQEKDVHSVKADVILTEENVHLDLTK